jgi:acyl-CoA thioesterase I
MAVRIVFFGDSICVGQNVSVHKIWVSLMSQAIHSALDEYVLPTGQELIVSNPSINGNTTRMALERMPFDVQQGGADFVYTQFGLNDCNYWMTDKVVARVTAQSYEGNLKEIIARARGAGAKKVAIGTNHGTTRFAPTHAGIDITYEDSRKQYNDIVRKIASEDPDLLLVDIAAMVEAEIATGRATLPETLHSDGLHLSELGHQIYFEKMRAHLLPAIEAAVRT